MPNCCETRWARSLSRLATASTRACGMRCSAGRTARVETKPGPSMPTLHIMTQSFLRYNEFDSGRPRGSMYGPGRNYEGFNKISRISINAQRADKSAVIRINLRKAHADRPFAALRVTREPCHAEGGEAARGPCRQTLRCGSELGLNEV